MLGAIIGDLVGSRWEFNPIKSKRFDFLTKENFLTDDSYMTLAIAKSFLECSPEYKDFYYPPDYTDLGELVVKNMREIGRRYPNGGYGGRFGEWLESKNPQPYNSFGNGSAMRVSPCGIVARSIEEAKMLSKKVTEVTHNHPEGIKGAEAVAVAIFLARSGKTQSEIKDYIDKSYYPMNFSIKEIRDSYEFNETCQGSVPQAIKCFVEAKDFEDCVRNAVSLGGDADTQAAIAGSIAEYCFGIPEKFISQAKKYLPTDLLEILTAFEEKFER
jgi:type I restriction enzyme M protein